MVMGHQLTTKKLGIIGGMGPEATVSMYTLVVRMTSAGNDQGHLEIFIHNNNRIPDRTKAIMGVGVSPVKELLRSAHYLEQSGADVIIIPCITSHFFLKDIQQHLTIPILNAVEETVDTLAGVASRLGAIAGTTSPALTLGQVQAHNIIY